MARVVLDWHGILSTLVWGYVVFATAFYLLGRDGLSQERSVDRIMTLLIWTGTALVVAVLGWMLLYLMGRGLPTMGFNFFTQDLSKVGPLDRGGGAKNAIIGTATDEGLSFDKMRTKVDQHLAETGIVGSRPDTRRAGVAPGFGHNARRFGSGKGKHSISARDGLQRRLWISSGWQVGLTGDSGRRRLRLGGCQSSFGPFGSLDLAGELPSKPGFEASEAICQLVESFGIDRVGGTHGRSGVWIHPLSVGDRVGAPAQVPRTLWRPPFRKDRRAQRCDPSLRVAHRGARAPAPRGLPRR